MPRRPRSPTSRRVTNIGLRSDLAVAGHAVADVTHLLAELLENATAFSPPTTPVIVAGGPSEHRYVLSVTDQGIGVDDERLAKLNELLARPPAPGLALSRTLGLHVVAYLAARHGIYVQLRRHEPVGVVAIVALPPAILAPTTATDGAAANGDEPRARPGSAPSPCHRPTPPPPTEEPAPVIVEPIPMPAASPEPVPTRRPRYAETPIRFHVPEAPGDPRRRAHPTRTTCRAVSCAPSRTPPTTGSPPACPARTCRTGRRRPGRAPARPGHDPSGSTTCSPATRGRPRGPGP